ncbi:MAG: DegV family protein, partial [Lachnospiraceae bacterium]|nr:DegV family protein [Lachnospiraceae bacterium]
MDYCIMMDVSGDILPEIAKQNDLDFIPMDYSIGEEMRTCTGPEDAATIHAFYEGQRHGDLTHTSQ